MSSSTNYRVHWTTNRKPCCAPTSTAEVRLFNVKLWNRQFAPDDFGYSRGEVGKRPLPLLNRMNSALQRFALSSEKVGTAALRNEKSCGSYVKPMAASLQRMLRVDSRTTNSGTTLRCRA